MRARGLLRHFASLLMTALLVMQGFAVPTVAMTEASMACAMSHAGDCCQPSLSAVTRCCDLRAPSTPSQESTSKRVVSAPPLRDLTVPTTVLVDPHPSTNVTLVFRDVGRLHPPRSLTTPILRI